MKNKHFFRKVENVSSNGIFFPTIFSPKFAPNFFQIVLSMMEVLLGVNVGSL